MFKRLTSFQAIQVVSNTDRRGEYSDLMNVGSNQIQLLDRSSYLVNLHTDFLDQYTDLLIIDVDAFGIDEACYLVFVAGVFMCNVPIVLVTRQEVPDSVRSRYLHSVGVLDVVRMIDCDHALTAV